MLTIGGMIILVSTFVTMVASGGSAGSAGGYLLGTVLRYGLLIATTWGLVYLFRWIVRKIKAWRTRPKSRMPRHEHQTTNRMRIHIPWLKIIALLLLAAAIYAFASSQLAQRDEWRTKKWCSDVLVGGNYQDKEYCKKLLRFYENE